MFVYRLLQKVPYIRFSVYAYVYVRACDTASELHIKAQMLFNIYIFKNYLLNCNRYKRFSQPLYTVNEAIFRSGNCTLRTCIEGEIILPDLRRELGICELHRPRWSVSPVPEQLESAFFIVFQVTREPAASGVAKVGAAGGGVEQLNMREKHSESRKGFYSCTSSVCTNILWMK